MPKRTPPTSSTAMQIHTDEPGNHFIEIENVRVTLVLAKDRPNTREAFDRAA